MNDNSSNGESAGPVSSQRPASRVQALERLVQDKDQAVEELTETIGALKLLQEKQTAELNAKDLLLTRKNERIEELLQQLKDKDTLILTKDAGIAHLHAKIQDLEAEVQDCRDQLSKEEDEFAMLSAAIETKEQQMAKKNDEIVSLKDVEKQLQKDVDRLQVQLRRLEKQVDLLQPETMDACLSPRSFSENQLIQLRDDAINAKTKEIWLLTGQNDQLRIQMDELEAELETLQTRFVSKENDVAKRDRVIEKLQAEIEALEVARQQAEGRERAIEIATTQNTKLLQALQAQEVQSDELKVHLEQLERECIQLRSLHRQNLEKSAVNEVEVLHKSKEVEHKSNLLTTLQDKLARERKSLHEELSQERMKAQLEVEKLQSELVMRRNKQYELTLRVQQVEAQLHEARDELETVGEKYIATQLRMEEAERVMQDALVWKRALEDELVKCRRDGDVTGRELLGQVEKAQMEVATLRGQLNELKESLLKSLDQQKKKDFQIQDLRRTVDSKDQLVVEQKERIARLVHEIAKGSQSKAESDLEKKLVADQLEKIKEQMSDALRECMMQQRRVEDKWKKAVDKYKALASEFMSEQKGKTKLLKAFLQAFSATSNKTTGPVTTFLDLRECWLADHDAMAVFAMLETHLALRRTLTRVDLRCNRLTHEAVRGMISYFRKTGALGCVRELDLRGNFISLDGLRSLANALETMPLNTDDRVIERQPQPLFAKVLVASGGRIECYPSTTIAPNEIPVLTVDVRENGDPDTLLNVSTHPGGVSMHKPLNRRRRDEGESSTDAVLQEIYGVDLVNAFMGDSKTDSKTSRHRRKSSDRPGVVEVDAVLSPERSAVRTPPSLLLPSHSSLIDVFPVSNNNQINAASSTNSPRSFGSPSLTRPPLLSSSASLPRLS